MLHKRKSGVTMIIPVKALMKTTFTSQRLRKDFLQMIFKIFFNEIQGSINLFSSQELHTV